MNIEKIKFHDSILNNIVVNWQKSEIIIEIELNLYFEQEVDKIKVILKDFIKFECPHEEPWGPSFYINSLTVDNNNTKTVLIELQSGDIIKITCNQIEVA